MAPGAAVTWLHIAAGTLVLGVAPAAMIVRKGGPSHRRWGLTFTFAMAAVLMTAAFMWQPHGHLFLFWLDFVCAYLVFQGFRVIARRRRKAPDVRADRIDLAAAALVLCCSAALLTLAATADTPLMRGLAPILASIAAIAGIFAALDLRALAARVQTRLGSLLVHISAMIGAYISAVTAFCVINFHSVPMAARWIVPSFIGTIVIGAFSTQYRRRFARRTRSAPMAAPSAERAPLPAAKPLPSFAVQVERVKN
jgi:hypothetical protein